MSEALTITDGHLQRRVCQELEWNHHVDCEGVGVHVKDGIVTLTGCVDSYAMKARAREAVHHVLGVNDVVDELEVRLDNPARSDRDIALAIREALAWDVFVPEKRIHSTVSEGWVTLQGEVSHWQQREDAAGSIERIEGVRGVTNELVVKPVAVEAAAIRASIEEAMVRRAQRGARRLSVAVADGRVILRGSVDSWAEKKALVGIAGHCPGVFELVDEVVVDPNI